MKLLASSAHRGLGRRAITGREVDGVEIRDPQAFNASFEIKTAVSRLWVDTEALLPVLLEADVTGP